MLLETLLRDPLLLDQPCLASPPGSPHFMPRYDVCALPTLLLPRGSLEWSAFAYSLDCKLLEGRTTPHSVRGPAAEPKLTKYGSNPKPCPLRQFKLSQTEPGTSTIIPNLQVDTLRSRACQNIIIPTQPLAKPGRGSGCLAATLTFQRGSGLSFLVLRKRTNPEHPTRVFHLRRRLEPSLQ